MGIIARCSTARLARTGWKVSEIGYGMWGMAGWTGSDDEESRQSLDRAVALGCNFFDTAWAYGDGRSEQLLGRAAEAASRQAALHRDARSRRRTASGRRGPSIRCATSSPPTTSASTPRSACATWARRAWTSSSSTSGTTRGRPTTSWQRAVDGAEETKGLVKRDRHQHQPLAAGERAEGARAPI